MRAVEYTACVRCGDPKGAQYKRVAFDGLPTICAGCYGEITTGDVAHVAGMLVCDGCLSRLTCEDCRNADSRILDERVQYGSVEPMMTANEWRRRATRGGLKSPRRENELDKTRRGVQLLAGRVETPHKQAAQLVTFGKDDPSPIRATCDTQTAGECARAGCSNTITVTSRARFCDDAECRRARARERRRAARRRKAA
jgi:hypothetical protein